MSFCGFVPTLPVRLRLLKSAFLILAIFSSSGFIAILRYPGEYGMKELYLSSATCYLDLNFVDISFPLSNDEAEERTVAALMG